MTIAWRTSATSRACHILKYITPQPRKIPSPRRRIHLTCRSDYESASSGSLRIYISVRKPSSIAWLLAAARLIGSNPLPRTALIAGAAIAATVIPQESKAALVYWNQAGTGGTWGSSLWGTSASGPFTGAWVASNDVVFGGSVVASATFATTTVGNVSNGTLYIAASSSPAKSGWSR